MFTTVIVQLLGTIVFAYVIGGVMNLVINFDPAARLTKQETQLLDGYMGHVKYSKIRKRRLRKAFHNFLDFKSTIQRKAAKILRKNNENKTKMQRKKQ